MFICLYRPKEIHTDIHISSSDLSESQELMVIVTISCLVV